MSDSNNPNGDLEHQMRHQTRLSEWEKKFDFAMHSDRLAGEIGVFVIKTILLVNGGASIALIGAFAGLSKHAAVGAELADGGAYFLWGLTCAVAGAVFAYFYQSVNTENEWFEMRKTFEALEEKPWTGTTRVILISITIVLMLISFALFILGAQHVLGAFQATTQISTGWML